MGFSASCPCFAALRVSREAAELVKMALNKPETELLAKKAIDGGSCFLWGKSVLFEQLGSRVE